MIEQRCNHTGDERGSKLGFKESLIGNVLLRPNCAYDNKRKDLDSSLNCVGS